MKNSMSSGGFKPNWKVLVTSEEFPPKSPGWIFVGYWETTTCLFHVWEFPLDQICQNSAFLTLRNFFLVGFENEYQSKTWSKNFLKNPILSVQKKKWKKLSPSHEYSQISLGDSHEKKGLLPLDSSAHLSTVPSIYSSDPNVKRWIVDGTSEENLRDNHTVTMCSSRSSKVDAFVLREKVGAEKCLVETACYKSSSSSLSQQNKTHILDAAYQPFTANSLKPCSVFP